MVLTLKESIICFSSISLNKANLPKPAVIIRVSISENGWVGYSAILYVPNIAVICLILSVIHLQRLWWKAVILHHRINTIKIQGHYEYNSNHRQCPLQRNVGQEGRRMFKDDMKELNPHLLEADVVVFVSPSYYFNINAQLNFPQKAYELGKNL